jgi:hypothetical protein
MPKSTYGDEKMRTKMWSESLREENRLEGLCGYMRGKY